LDKLDFSVETTAKNPTGVSAQAKPFLKWAGGKQQLLQQFESLFPTDFERYIEPFIGGGAVYFHLWNTQRVDGEALLFDINSELVNTYRIVRDKPEYLIEVLKTHKHRHSREYYYHVRNLDRNGKQLNDIERAARILYLNKTCFNGLFRVNSKGQFNVPIGSYKNPRILDEELLRAASLALQQAIVEVRDFRSIVDLAQAGDFFYFDPPYDPVSKTASFTSYTTDSFGNEDQSKLADVFQRLTNKGCLCMLSNSHTEQVLDLYRHFRIEIVTANRAINSDPQKRGGVLEVVVLNY
jgi:DNA adenine methylase